MKKRGGGPEAIQNSGLEEIMRNIKRTECSKKKKKGGSSEGEAELRFYLSGKHQPAALPVHARIGTSVTDHHRFLLSNLPVSSLAPYSPSLHEAL